MCLTNARVSSTGAVKDQLLGMLGSDSVQGLRAVTRHCALKVEGGARGRGGSRGSLGLRLNIHWPSVLVEECCDDVLTNLDGDDGMDAGVLPYTLARQLQ